MIKFSEHARADQIAEDADWRNRNNLLLDQAEELKDSKPLLAAALVDRFYEMEQQRLTWKMHVLERLENEC